MAMLVSFYMPYKVSTFLIYVIHVCCGELSYKLLSEYYD